MSQHYDATSKFFMTRSPQDWLALIGAPHDLDVIELDSDISTVSARVDKLLEVKGDHPRIEHIEVQSGRDTTVPVRVCRYGVIVHYARNLPVNSSVILLYPGADGQELDGLYVANSCDGVPFLQYRYQVVRIWELPPEAFLNAGIGVLPLAPLGKIQEADLAKLLAVIDSRVEIELDPAERADFWGGMSILMGFRFHLNVIKELMRGRVDVEDNPLAQMLFNKGREAGRQEARQEGQVQGERWLLKRTIARHFGSIDPRLEQLVENLATQAEIETFLDRVLDATSVEELL
jgi:predicted transposase YdaD